MKESHSFFARLSRKIGGLIEWNPTDKAFVIAAGSLSFGIINLVVVYHFRAHPEKAGNLNVEVADPILVWLWFVAFVYAALAAAGLFLRRRNPNSRAYVRILIYFWWTATAAYAYWVGPFQNASVGQLVLAGGIFGFLLFDHRIVLEGLGVFVVVLAVTTLAEHTGWLPHAPMMKPAGGPALGATDSRVPGLPGLFLLFAALMLAVFYYTVSLWRDREAKLAKAHQDLKQAHEDLLAAQQQLVRAESLAAVGSLVSGAAHELRNPLASSGGLLQSLRDEVLESSQLPKESRREIAQTLEMALKGQDRASAIVERLYRLSDDLSHAGSRYQLGRLVEDLRERYAGAEFRAKNLPGELRINQRVVVTILANLIDNALAAGATKPPLVEAAWEEGTLLFSVTDEGRGIPAEHQRKIFKPFFTLNKTGEGHGVGLGLYIVHELVTRMGGSVELESEEGKGTRVRVHLPLGMEPEN